MAFVRMLGNLLKDKAAGSAHRADRRRRGAHLRHGQPVQAGRHLFQRGPALRAGGHRLGAVATARRLDGQILEEGISEAGAIASWTAAATSYSVHGLPMLPFYIYYSMFGFQRVGDAIWAAADQRSRGFLLGATSGRTTLGGEGLQHQDGTQPSGGRDHSELQGLRPGLRRRDGRDHRPGMREMLVEQQDVFYYVTLMNENYAQPDLPAGVEQDVVRGCYRFGALWRARSRARRRAGHADGLGRDPDRGDQGGAAAGGEGIACEVFSVTSWSELARDGAACEQRALARRGRPARPSSRSNCWQAQRPDHRRHRLRARRAGKRPRLPARRAAATSRWAPTASAAATRARRCATSSGSTRRASRRAANYALSARPLMSKSASRLNMRK